MKHKYLEAYEFYKRQYQGNVILFHIGCRYRAFEDDSYIVAGITNCCLIIAKSNGHYYCEINQDELEGVLCKFRKREIPVTVVEYRNSSGSFDIPKVKQIMEDIEADY